MSTDGYSLDTTLRHELIEPRDGRAVGVEYVSDTVMDPDADQRVFFVRASKLVVLSAGAFGSPTILERSGIGGKTVLEANGVKQLVDLPGVGENYQGIKVHCFVTTALHGSEST